MKYGIREIADVVLRAKSTMTFGGKTFYKDEPVLSFDSLKTSSLEGAATTVYAQGGRGYSRLVAWEGERTLTFNMEDALASMETLSLLSGSSLLGFKGNVSSIYTLKNVEIMETNESYYGTAPSVRLYYSNENLLGSDEEENEITIDVKQWAKISATVNMVGSDLSKEEQQILLSDYGIVLVDSTNEVINSNSKVIPFDGKPFLVTKDATQVKVCLARTSSSTDVLVDKIIPSIKIEIINSTGQYEKVCLSTEAKTVVSATNSEGKPTKYTITIPFDKWRLACGSDSSLMPAWIYPQNTSFGNQTKALQYTALSYAGDQISVSAASNKTFWNGPTIVEFYTPVYNHSVQQVTIDPGIVSANFYLEANTLFRDTDGADHSAVFEIPNCKIQSNFTLTMGSSGDPSTFSFVLDAFPGYSRFDAKKKVLAMLKIVEDDSGVTTTTAPKKSMASSTFEIEY